MEALDVQARRQTDAVAELHPGLSRALRRLDRSAIADLARESVALHTIDPVLLEAVFASSFGAEIAAAYVTLANVAADGVPATPQAQGMGERAGAALAKDLAVRARTRAGLALAEALNQGWPLARLIRRFGEILLLSDDIARWVFSYARALQSDPRSALDRALRDTSFDPRAARGALTPTEISEMVAAYRRNLVAQRAGWIARDALGTAANQMAAQTWLDAEAAGLVLPGLRKFWIDMDDRLVRSHHHDIPEMNPGGVMMTDHFATPLGPLLFPHDPSGSADNTNGCRCMVAVARRS